MVVHNFRQGTGSHVGGGAGHGVNLGLHGRVVAGGRGRSGQGGFGRFVEVGKDRDAGAGVRGRRMELFHRGHVGKVDGR